MLTNSLYNLSFLLSMPYNNINLISKHKYNLDDTILKEIYLKKLFNFEWAKKLNSSFKDYKFDYAYNILEQIPSFIKVKLILKASFIVKTYPQNINSVSINEYILILEYLQDKCKIQFIAENEENPLLYEHILNTDLSSLVNSRNFNKNSNINVYKDKLSSIDSLFEMFIASSWLSTNNHDEKRASKFNVTDACDYAERFSLNYNPEYKSFSGIGGDCTNFMSQIIHAGGFSQNATWKPYTHAWIRVEELYQYLITPKLEATKLPNDKSLDRGCLIQFYTPSIGRYFHNGFITYRLQNGDCLYCCHSYDKLNYPLSQIYPNRYPTLRALKFD
ncbi:amidase domain-containing protein [Clostridium sp. YIM B02569]|uniref:amidase domain-containing protein n=1 Tax=Clostridium sp. YIM B02569 TaxID=2911967 RepID=UPI001EEAF800|nr:amidase domain-containing protein [Clostridium sp. YIM B02569]